MKNINLHTFKKRFSLYTELRAQENKQVQISFIKGNNKDNNIRSSRGVSARVYQSGSWGYASSPDIEGDEISRIIREAEKNASFLDAQEKKGLKELPQHPYTHESDFSTSKPRMKQEELVDFIRAIDSYIVENYPELSSRSVVLHTLDMEKKLVTSDGSEAYSFLPRAFIRLKLVAEKEGETFELYDSIGGLGQFEDRFNSPSDLHGEIDELHEHLMRKKEGVFADAGRKECVLDAELAGILAHEAIGHTTEGDFVLGGSVARDYMNEKAASSLITLVDYANTAFDQICPVPIYVDDEGTRAKDVVIIEDGILKKYMHNKSTARHFNDSPTGNARAYSFSDEPLVRMRNTAIVPGENNLEEMIKSVDDGYYLIRPGNGQADSTSEFMFGVMLGYEIKNGSLDRAIRDTTISGVAIDVLKTVDMVSDEMTWLSSGMCGKKQPIPVGLGGPAIKCEINIGGR